MVRTSLPRLRGWWQVGAPRAILPAVSLWPLPSKPLAVTLVAAGLGAAALAWLFTSGKSRRVAMIGDSLAVGLGPFMAKLAKAKGVPFLYDATGGTTPLQWAQHAKACGGCGDAVLAFDPSVTLVVLGTNDLGYSPAPPAAPYRAIVQRFPGVVWVDPPLMPNDRLAGVRGVISSLGVPVIPSTNTIQIGPDGIHPTGQGYADWAKLIWGLTP